MTAEAAASSRPPAADPCPSDDPKVLADIVQWDIGNWGRAIRLWDRELGADWSGLRALDVGAGGGGLTLYLNRRGCRTVYCDFRPPRSEARELFRRYGIADAIESARADVTRLPFASAQFDLVAFKSLLVSVIRILGPDAHRDVIREIHRVLRPGGYVLFAENAHGSALHDFSRRHFTSWGRESRYPGIDELRAMFGTFATLRLESFGVAALFGRTEWQRSLLSRIDRLVTPWVKESSRYLVYGYARK